MKECETLKFTLHNRMFWIQPGDKIGGRRQHKGFIDGQHVVNKRTRHEVCRSLLKLAA